MKIDLPGTSPTSAMCFALSSHPLLTDVELVG